MTTKKSKRWLKFKLQRDEQGAALLIAMLAVVLMTVIGVVLLQVVRDGLIHSAAAEAEIRAEILAQNGLDEALLILRNAVDYGNHFIADGEEDAYRKRIDKVQEYLEEAMHDASDHPSSAPGIFRVDQDYGSYTVDFTLSEEDEEQTKLIRSYESSVQPHPDTPFVYQVIVRSTGETNGSPKRRITKTMKVFISTIDPVFRYPLSADEEIRLHGGPYIIGDLVAKDRLSVTNRVNFSVGPNTHYTAMSSYPSMKGFVRVLDNNYSKDDNPLSGFTRDMFHDEKPFEDTQLTLSSPIGIASIVDTKLEQAADFSANAHSESAPDWGEIAEGAQAIPPRATVASKESPHGVQFPDDAWVTVYGDWTVYGDVIVKDGVFRVNRLAPDADDPNASNDNTITLYNGSLYVDMPNPHIVAMDVTGCLNLHTFTEPENSEDEESTLNREAFVAVNGNVTLTNFSLNGSMFIRGDLKVIGDLNINGSLYVDGNVEMKEMTSVNQAQSSCGDFTEKPVIVMATGEVILSDNQTDVTEEQIDIRAFLYSLQNLNLYGVRSKLHFYGGLHGKNVDLNAMRGQYSSEGTMGFSNPNITPSLENYYFTDDQANLEAEKSRLQVVYDLALYTNPPDGIPVTDQVNVFVQEIRSDR